MKRLRLPESDQPFWYHALLVMLVLTMLARPVADLVQGAEALMIGLTSLTLLAAVMALGRSRGSRILAWVALVPSVMLTALFRDHDAAQNWAGQALGALIMLLVCGRIVHRIFTTEHVTWAKISGAIAVFLLLSFVWGTFYSLAAWSTALEPAFNGLAPASELLRSPDMPQTHAKVEALLSYFSLVTQTTLGYGDLSPAHPITRSLATSQAVVGQLYLVVLVARLVSMRTQSSDTTSE